jgi:hypothetical protein
VLEKLTAEARKFFCQLDKKNNRGDAEGHCVLSSQRHVLEKLTAEARKFSCQLDKKNNRGDAEAQCWCRVLSSQRHVLEKLTAEARRFSCQLDKKITAETRRRRGALCFKFAKACAGKINRIGGAEIFLSTGLQKQPRRRGGAEPVLCFKFAKAYAGKINRRGGAEIFLSTGLKK